MDHPPPEGLRHRIWYGDLFSSRSINPLPDRRQLTSLLPHPPQQPRPMDIFLPPPPPPSHSVFPCFNSSPSKRVVGRSHFYEPENSLSEPYIRRNPPLPPFPPRCNRHFQFSDGSYRPGPFSGRIVDSRAMYGRDDDDGRLFHVTACRPELSIQRQFDVERRRRLDNEWDFGERRSRNSINGNCRQFYRREDDGVQSWSVGVNDRAPLFCNERKYAERKCSIGIEDGGRLFCNGREFAEGIQRVGAQNRGRLLFNERHYVDGRFGASVQDRDHRFHKEIDDVRRYSGVANDLDQEINVDRYWGGGRSTSRMEPPFPGPWFERHCPDGRLNNGINYHPDRRYTKVDGGGIRRGIGYNEGLLPVNLWTEGFVERDLNCDGNKVLHARPMKRQRLMNADVVNVSQLRKDCNRDLTDFNSGREGREIYQRIKTESMCSGESRQSSKVLAKSWKFNSMVSKDKFFPSHLDVKCGFDLMNEKKKPVYGMPVLSLVTSRKELVKPKMMSRMKVIKQKPTHGVASHSIDSGKNSKTFPVLTSPRKTRTVENGLFLKSARSFERSFASYEVADEDHANRLVVAAEASDDTNELKFGEGNSSANQTTEHSDSFFVREEANVSRSYVQNRELASGLENIEFELKEDEIRNIITEGPSHEESTVVGPPEIIVSLNDPDNACNLKCESYRISETRSEISQPISSSEAGKPLVQKPLDSVFIHLEYDSSDSSVFLLNPGAAPLAELNAEDMRLSGGDADFNCSEGIAQASEIFPPDSLSTGDGNAVHDSIAHDGLLVSDFAIGSCVSSPKVSSELTPSSNSVGKASEQENEIAADCLFNGNSVPEDLYEVSLGKSLDDEGDDEEEDDLLICLGDTAFPSEDNKNSVKKINFINEEVAKKRILAKPQVFSHRPSKYRHVSNPNSACIAKSRTWHRSGNVSVVVAEPRSQSSTLPVVHKSKMTENMPSTAYIRQGNSLVRNPSPSGVFPPAIRSSVKSVYKLASLEAKNTQQFKGKVHEVDASSLLAVKPVTVSKSLALNRNVKAVNCPSDKSLLTRNVSPCRTSDALKDTKETILVPKCPSDSRDNAECLHTPEEEQKKEIVYIKRKRNQLVAASTSTSRSVVQLDKSKVSLTDGYYKSKKNQLVRKSSSNHTKRRASLNFSKVLPLKTITKPSTRQMSTLSKAFVWNLHATESPKTRKVLPLIVPWKRATHWRSCKYALNIRRNVRALPTSSKRYSFSRKRGTVYLRSSHGYSLKMSGVRSVAECSLKGQNPPDMKSENTNEGDACTSTATMEQNNDEGPAVHMPSTSRSSGRHKVVPCLKLQPGERVFRIGSERYKLDSKRKTLLRITESDSLPQMNDELSPRRLSIGWEQYVRNGNGNQLVRDPKRRTRILASEKVRWSLRTARLRLARKKKYCQFFTRYGKCNKDDGKCPYIHDPSKIVVCTKFLSGCCSNADCRLTHKVISERMEDCSFFPRGLCTNDDCPYRHVHVNPNLSICEGFLRGYCAEGNECQKKHTYVCPAFEATGTCPQASTCKLHHPKKKAEKSMPPPSDMSAVRGRYFDGGLISHAWEELWLPSKGGKIELCLSEGKFPDYISLDVGGDDDDEEQASSSPVIVPQSEIEEEVVVYIDEDSTMFS